MRDKSAVLKNIVPPILTKAESIVEKQAAKLRKEAERAMSEMLGEELDRLNALKNLGHPIRDEELEASAAEREQLFNSLESARLRLDSVRLILLQP